MRVPIATILLTAALTAPTAAIVKEESDRWQPIDFQPAEWLANVGRHVRSPFATQPVPLPTPPTRSSATDVLAALFGRVDAQSQALNTTFPTAAGRTAGEFAVSPTGASTYTIPIWTPPGIRDLQPSLALTYSSQGGDGLLGDGWSLSGLAAVTRCNATWAQNGQASSPNLNSLGDRYCLGGAQLRLLDGSAPGNAIYSTEVDDYSRATPKPAAFTSAIEWWEVKEKDGLIHEYGNSADSRIEAVGSSYPREWALSSVRDRIGNSMRFIYDEDAPNTTGGYRPLRIEYTLSATGQPANYQVLFQYEARPSGDTLVGYTVGGIVRESKRLSAIVVQSRSGSSWVTQRAYNLAYDQSATTGQSRLTAVQECGATSCLLPTTVTYQSGAPGVGAQITALSVAASPNVIPVDYNADGRTDLLYQTVGGNAVSVAPGQVNGTFGAAVSTNFTGQNARPLLPFDFNGDGRVGFIGVRGSLALNTEYVVVDATASGWTSTSLGFSYASGIWGDVLTGDVDGDGRDDLLNVSGTSVQWRRNTGGAFAAVQTLLTLPSGTIFGNSAPFGSGAQVMFRSQVETADFNADGRLDFLVYTSSSAGLRWEVWFSNTSGAYWSVDAVSAPFSAQPILADINNDRCTDLVFASGGVWNLAVSRCGRAGATLFDPPEPILAPAVSTGITDTGATRAVVMDWDGDDRLDILAPNGTEWRLIRSLGDSLAPAVGTGVADPGASAIAFVVDTNGDAQSDLLYYTYNFSGNDIFVRLHNGAFTPPDLATSIYDGYGMGQAMAYDNITRNNYVAYDDATFPNRVFNGPMYVTTLVTPRSGRVSGAQVYDTYTQSYWYWRGWLNLEGRGFLGFSRVGITDSRTTLVTSEFYNRDFPRTGTVNYRDVRQTSATGPLVSSVAQDWSFALDSSGQESRYRVYQTYAVEKGYELGGPKNGVQITEKRTTTSAPNVYGNVTTVAVDLEDKDVDSPDTGTRTYTTTTTNAFHAPDTTNWCVGLPYTQTVASRLPDSTTQTRSVEMTKDTITLAACRNRIETIEPASSTLRVTTTFGFDSCGNTNLVSVVGRRPDGTNMPTRTTTTNFGTRCQFPESITNPVGDITANEYWYEYGTPKRQTDASGVWLQWDYDEYGRKRLETRMDNTKIRWTRYNCVATNSFCGVADLRSVVYQEHLSTTDAVLRLEMQFFDGMNRLRYDEKNNAANKLAYQVNEYDSRGRRVVAWMPGYAAQAWAYHVYTFDELDRPAIDKFYTAAGALDRQTSIAFEGRRLSYTDAKSNVTQKIVDVRGKTRRITDPGTGGVTTHLYDHFGNLISSTDPIGVLTTHIYNLRGHRTGMNDPNGGARTFNVNSLGEVVNERDAKTTAPSWTRSFIFDNAGRLLQRQEPGGNTTWSYGNASTTSASNRNHGRLRSMTFPGGSETYTYDSFGRPFVTDFMLDGQPFQIDYAYNATTGLLQTLGYPDSTGTQWLRAEHLYVNNELTSIRNFDAPATIWWQLGDMDARGNPIDERFGNGVRVYSDYDPLTGHLNSRRSGTSGAYSQHQNLTFEWDPNENLKKRIDTNRSLTEEFFYDQLDRLDYSTLNGSTNLNVTLDAAGNITYKSEGIGANNVAFNYTYHPTRRHAVASTSNGWTFSYDNNGNMTTGRGKTIAWTSFDLPGSITEGSIQSTFAYNGNRQYYRQVANYGANGTETTYYVGGIFERVTGSGSGTTDYRHMIRAGSATIIVTRSTGSNNKTYYSTQDHLGSANVITDETAAVVTSESFAAYGKRRNATTWDGGLSTTDWTAISQTTRRGFTGHTMLDNFGGATASFIHMNGRVYDPEIGRFLSVDPVIQTIEASQALNAYAYVWNNPLKYTDPTGMFLKKLFKKIGKFLKKHWKAIVAVVAAIAVQHWVYSSLMKSASAKALTTANQILAGSSNAAGALASYGSAMANAHMSATLLSGAAAGAASGAVAGGFQGAIKGAFGGLLGSVGAGVYASSWTVGRVGLEAIAGGASSAIQGGSFADGFRLSGIGAASRAIYAWSTDGMTPSARGGGRAVVKESYLTPPDEMANNWGMHNDSEFGLMRARSNSFSRLLHEGSAISRVANAIPGMNATATLHDWWMTRWQYTDLGFNLWNVPTMPLAVGAAYGAVVQPLTPWINIARARP